MTEKVEKVITIFEAVGKKEQDAAIKNLLSGKTPASDIKDRPARGQGKVNYVNTYYMTRQISLLTGFRWKSECLEERFLPDDKDPREVGAKMLVTIWDASNNSYSHQSWGQKDIAKWSSSGANHKAGDPISIFDDLKAAYSDGIKKCLSYFGIANDVYGGKELEFFTEPEEGETVTVDYSGGDAMKAFGKFLEKNHIPWSEAFEILGTRNIPDYKEAYGKVKEVKGIK